MPPLLTPDKQTHLAHVILKCLQKAGQATIVGDSTVALREIKRILTEQVTLEEELDRTIRSRLQSYSRPIPEGSEEWNVMYRKTYLEELRKRNLG